MLNSILKLLNQIYLITNDYLIYIYLKLSNNFNLKNNEKFLIISASDSSHFKSLCQLLDSLRNYCKNDDVVIYDLGFIKNELDYLKDKYPKVKIIKFNFAKYPKYVNLKQKDAGAYAWKPIIIYNEFVNSDNPILWMDAGNVVIKNIDFLKFYIKKYNFFSPNSSNNIKRWTHSTTLEKLKVSKKILKKRNLNAALVGFNKSSDSEILLTKWYNSALVKNLILPPGSGKLNHRWDQSLLSIHYYKEINNTIRLKTYKLWGILIHQDID